MSSLLFKTVLIAGSVLLAQIVGASNLILGSSGSDGTAITITDKSGATTLRGFTIKHIYPNASDCSGTDYAPNAFSHTFGVPQISVSDGVSTAIGSGALYNTFAAAYYSASGSQAFPSTTTGMSVVIAAVTQLNYSTLTANGNDLSASAGGSAACIVLNCSSTTQTCSSNLSTAYY